VDDDELCFKDGDKCRTGDCSKEFNDIIDGVCTPQNCDTRGPKGSKFFKCGDDCVHEEGKCKYSCEAIHSDVVDGICEVFACKDRTPLEVDEWPCTIPNEYNCYLQETGNCGVSCANANHYKAVNGFFLCVVIAFFSLFFIYLLI
jgi:hypothetical protein